MEIGIRPFAPHITISDHLKCALVFVENLIAVAYGNVHGKICSYIKRRVYIDKIDFAFEVFQ